MNQEELATTIVAMEKAALDAWNKGNPSGYLDLYADDISYIDPVQRLNGFEKVKELYESARGQINIEICEMINPVVQIVGETAVLSFTLEYPSEATGSQWNCTEVYRQQPNKQWKIIHSHWSLMKQL